MQGEHAASLPLAVIVNVLSDQLWLLGHRHDIHTVNVYCSLGSNFRECAALKISRVLTFAIDSREFDQSCTKLAGFAGIYSRLRSRRKFAARSKCDAAENQYSIRPIYYNSLRGSTCQICTASNKDRATSNKKLYREAESLPSAAGVTRKIY